MSSNNDNKVLKNILKSCLTEPVIPDKVVHKTPALKPKIRVKKRMQDLDDEQELVDLKKDPIVQYSKKMRRKNKSDPSYISVHNWDITQFINYIKRVLRDLSIEVVGSRADHHRSISSLYDEFTGSLKTQMSNQILKDYLDWWISCINSRLEQFTNLRIFNNPSTIKKFLSRYSVTNSSIGSAPLTKEGRDSAQTKSSPDPDRLYQLGGVNLLLISQGVIITLETIQKQNPAKTETDIIIELQNVLRGFTRNNVLESLNQTLNNAPYSFKSSIDFFALYKPVLDYHKIDNYNDCKYKDYFEQ